jgi:hypothetical protein
MKKLATGVKLSILMECGEIDFRYQGITLIDNW